MSDNIYKVLMGDNAPFGGLANKNYFDRTLKGEIVDVHYTLMEQNGEALELQQYGYRTVDVRWLSAKPYTSTNLRIPELVSFKGGCGLNYLPQKGDIVIASFDSNNTPIITNIIARCSVYEHGALNDETKLPELNSYGDPLTDLSIPLEIRPKAIRYIIPGEISLKSQWDAELFLDKYGAAKIIVRDETNEELQMGDRLWEISTGKTIIDEGTNEVKKNSYGNNVQFQVLGHKNGCKVDFDDKGNIEIINNGNKMTLDAETGSFIISTSTGNSISLTDGVIKVADNNGNSITMNSSGIQLGDGANFSAVLGENLTALLTTMIAIFNSHVHPGVSGGHSSTSITTTPMSIRDILSKTIKLKG